MIAFIAFSCSKAEELTPSETVVGRWTVAEYYVNGQSQSGVVFSRFYIESDGTFLLEDANDLPYVGDWTATADNLSLIATDGTEFNIDIVFLEYERMQLVLTVAAVETLEIRYLLNRNDNLSY